MDAAIPVSIGSARRAVHSESRPKRVKNHGAPAAKNSSVGWSGRHSRRASRSDDARSTQRRSRESAAGSASVPSPHAPGCTPATTSDGSYRWADHSTVGFAARWARDAPRDRDHVVRLDARSGGFETEHRTIGVDADSAALVGRGPPAAAGVPRLDLLHRGEVGREAQPEGCRERLGEVRTQREDLADGAVAHDPASLQAHLRVGPPVVDAPQQCAELDLGCRELCNRDPFGHADAAVRFGVRERRRTHEARVTVVDPVDRADHRCRPIAPTTPASVRAAPRWNPTGRAAGPVSFLHRAF